MTKRRKIVLGAIGIVFLGGWFVCWNMGRLVKAGIEYFGPQVLGVPVTVSSVLLSPFGGYCRVSGLEVGNPPGYQEKTLMRVGSIAARVELGSVTGNLIVLREVDIRKPEIHWEGDLSGSNVSKLEARADRAAGRETTAPAGQQKAILIRRLTIDDARADVRLHLLGEKRLSLRLPPLVMSNVGSRNPRAAAAKIAGALFGEIGAALVRQIRAQALRL